MPSVLELKAKAEELKNEAKAVRLAIAEEKKTEASKLTNEEKKGIKAETVSLEQDTVMLPADCLIVHPNNGDRKPSLELLASVKQYGILSRLDVSRDDENIYIIEDGNCRYLAAVEAGMAELPCRIVPAGLHAVGNVHVRSSKADCLAAYCGMSHLPEAVIAIRLNGMLSEAFGGVAMGATPAKIKARWHGTLQRFAGWLAEGEARVQTEMENYSKPRTRNRKASTDTTPTEDTAPEVTEEENEGTAQPLPRDVPGQSGLLFNLHRVAEMDIPCAVRARALLDLTGSASISDQEVIRALTL